MTRAGWVMALLVTGCLPLGQSAPRSFKRSPPSKPIAEFPSPALLAAVEAKPVELPTIESGEVPPEGWTVEGAPPDPGAGAAWTPKGVWEEALAAAFVASGGKGTPTRTMACVAGELGRFYLKNKTSPPEPLQRFLNASCGVFSPAVSSRWLTGAAPAGEPDAALLARWRDQLRPELTDRIAAGAREVGFWSGRHNGRLAVVVTTQANPVELKPISTTPDAKGDLTIEGRLDGSASSFAGYINQGRFGVGGCSVDPAMVRPAFRITCRLAPEDDTAWIQIVYTAQRSVLEVPLAVVLARRDATKALLFSEVPHAASHPVVNEGAFAPAVLEGLNAVRAEARLPPVRLSDPESAAAARLARHYFAAALSQGGFQVTGDMNTIALGLLAGWQVAGTIREGSFFSAIVPRTLDAGRWLDTALALPMGRQTLLAPDIEEIALGPALFTAPAGIGGIVCSYRFQHGDDHSADVDVLLRRIVSARSAASLSPPVRLGGAAAAIGRQLVRVQQGIEAPIDALRLTLDDASAHFGGRVQGYVVEATSLDAVEFPKAILTQPGLRLEIGITHYRPPGAAWAQLVIVFVYAVSATVEI